MTWRTRNPYLLERRSQGLICTAHGGASWEASPNTLRAVQRARQARPDYVELDVHISQDGHLVLWHDPVVVTPQEVFVIAQTSLSTLRALPLPDGQFITLAEAIEELRGRCGVMIDLKAPGLEGAIGSLLTDLNFKEVIVCGGYSETLGRLKAAMPHLAVSLTPDASQYRDLSAVIQDAAFLDAVTVYWRTVNRDMVQALHAVGVMVLAWTVDYPEVAEQLVMLGVDGLTSNNMGLFKGSKTEITRNE